MKKYFATALALLLAASLFTGCGCTNRNVSDHPGGIITDPTTVAPSTNPIPTMTTPPEPSTVPHSETTMPTYDTAPGMTDATVDTESGTGDTGDTGGTMDTEPAPSRSRSRTTDRRS